MPSVECVCTGVCSYVSLCNGSLGEVASLFPQRNELQPRRGIGKADGETR